MASKEECEMITKSQAEGILQSHLDRLKSQAGDMLRSVVLVGSLASGSFTGDSGSDLDLVHILRDDAPEGSRERVLKLIAQTELETEKCLPISRCVYRFSQLKRPYPEVHALCLENKDLIELPIELLRMKDIGRTVLGADVLEEVDMPRREDVVRSLKCSAAWARAETTRGFRPIPDEQLPIRLIVQSVLVRALLDYYFATGKSCSDKSQVASLLRRDVAGYALQELTELCTKWRYEPEAFSADDEAWLLALWPQWRIARTGRDVDHVPILAEAE